jgi:cytochrome c-type biogenesis protein CcmH
MRVSARGWGWLAMAVLVVGVFGYGALDDGGRDGGDAARAQRLEESIMCPTCRGQSVADSDSSAADGISNYIRDAVGDGASDAEIRDYLAGQYGDDILLTPERGGVQGLVWILPVVAVVGAFAGLGLAFRTWRRQKAPGASDADRALVDRALHDAGATP